MVVHQMTAQILRLPLQRSVAEQVIDELKEHARMNELKDLLVIARFTDGDHRMGMAGRYIENPEEALAAVRFADRTIRWQWSFKKG